MWNEIYDPEDFENETTTIVASRVIHQTEKAVLFDSVKGEFWIPKSMIVHVHGCTVHYNSRHSIRYVKEHLIGV